jgi:membrane protease YdiL (CAAX protease family)
MSSEIKGRVTTALTVAVFIALAAIVVPHYVLPRGVARVALTQGVELVLSLLAIVLLGKSRFAAYGFCLPGKVAASSGSQHRWLLLSLIAPLLGMAASLIILFSGGAGNPAAKQLTFPQIILFVWILASTIEEIFTRGFLQGHLAVLSGRYVKLLFFRIELPAFISAVFFACMHLVLLTAGVDAVTMVITLLFTFSLGLLAGHLRAITGSLLPAIVAHILANIGGMIGGIIYGIISYLTTGKLPGA